MFARGLCGVVVLSLILNIFFLFHSLNVSAVNDFPLSCGISDGNPYCRMMYFMNASAVVSCKIWY